MNKDEMNRAIAEVLKWTQEPSPYFPDVMLWTTPDGKFRGRVDDKSAGPPDYASCLNAMAEAKRQLLTTPELCDDFNTTLCEEKPPRPVEFETDKWTWGQSAEVEARALLRTLSLYQDTRES